jgi:hypothetical protein
MNVVAFAISLALFIGGLFLMGYAFSTTGYEMPMFFGGIIVTALGVFIPIHVLKRLDA